MKWKFADRLHNPPVKQDGNHVALSPAALLCAFRARRFETQQKKFAAVIDATNPVRP
jgi:hypothetical protein